MSIRIASFLPAPAALTREARLAFAHAAAALAGAECVLVLAQAVRPFPAIASLSLFAALLVVLDHRLAAYHPHPRLGAANRITLIRAGIAGLILSRAIDAEPLAVPERWLIAGAAAIALVLDGVDGWAARREGLTSAFGARFDMEIDALSILILSVLVMRAASVPVWVLAIGLMRYLRVGAAQLLPALRRGLPPHRAADRRRKAIAVVQSLVLIFALAPATPGRSATIACAAALLLLLYSFAADLVMLRPGRDK